MAPGICAVLLADAAGRVPEAVAGAVADQTRKPERRVEVPGDPSDPRDQLRTALEGGERWLWLLDGSAVPEPGALERMVEAMERLEELPAGPVLFASTILDRAGGLHGPSLPVVQVLDPDLAATAVARRLLSLRLAHGGSLLVSSAGVELILASHPRLTPFGDDLQWSARLLMGRPGLLVPDSVAVSVSTPDEGCRRAARRELAAQVRLLAGDALDRVEKPWFAFRLLEESLNRLRPG